MTKFFGLFVAVAAFLAAPAYSQCPSCEPQPALDCKLNFDGDAVYLSTVSQLACRADVIAPFGETKTNTCRRTFGPPFLLIDHSIAEHSSNNGSSSVSRYASGAKIEYKEQIDEAYEKAIEIAGKYGDKAGEAKLKEMRKRHLDLMVQYSTNQDSIELKVDASGHGWELDRKRGWQDTSVTARVACILPVNLKDQITAYVGLKGDQVTVRNRTAKPIYAYNATVASASSCSSAKGAAIIRLNPNQSESYTVPITNGQPGKVCMHYYDIRPQAGSLAKSCEYSPGANNEISALPAQCSN